MPAAAPDEGGGPLCEEVSFDAAQCAKSFLYEALPMYASLLMVLFVECALNRRSIRATLALARNRMLYVTTWEGAPPLGAPRAASVTMQVLLYLLPNWCMVCALALWYYDADVRRLIDLWELLAFWMIVLMRHLVVGLKYGYLPAAELAAQYSPQYKGLQLAKGIFLGGWATPRAPGFGIVMEQVDAAMWLCDVDLRRCKLQLKLKDATPGYSTTMTAHELALKIAYVSFGRPLAASAGPAAMLTGCLIPFLPPIGRLSVGLAGFGGGTSWAPKLAMFCLIWGPWSLIWLMCAFHRLSLHSYSRRATAMELIDGLCSLGVPSAELELEGEPEPEPEPKPEPEPGLQSEPADPEITALEPPPPQPQPAVERTESEPEPRQPAGSAHITLDFSDPTTVVSVLLLRRCLRHYGARYHARIDAFSLALFATGYIFVALLDIFFVFSPDAFEHRASTDLLLAVLGVYICVAVGMLVIAAAKCNQAERFRSVLQRAALAATGEMYDVSTSTMTMDDDSDSGAEGAAAAAAAAGGEAQERQRQRRWMGAVALKELLLQADAQTHFEEEVSSPVTVLSIPAEPTTVKATLGAVGVGLALALEGYVQLIFVKGWGYREDNGYLFSAPGSV